MTTHDKDKIIAAAKEAEIQVIFDAKFGRDDYQSIFSSFPALERFYAIAFEAGAASRDAEIAELVAALKRIRKQQETIGQTGNSAWTTADFALAKVRKP